MSFDDIKWYHWIIIAVVVIVLLLLTMNILSVYSQYKATGPHSIGFPTYLWWTWFGSPETTTP